MKTKATHTPGPDWVAATGWARSLAGLLSEPEHGLMTWNQAVSNSAHQLLVALRHPGAAAPDLLKALERCRDFTSSVASMTWSTPSRSVHDELVKMRDKARTAIAKARDA